MSESYRRDSLLNYSEAYNQLRISLISPGSEFDRLDDYLTGLREIPDERERSGRLRPLSDLILTTSRGDSSWMGSCTSLKLSVVDGGGGGGGDVVRGEREEYNRDRRDKDSISDKIIRSIINFPTDCVFLLEDEISEKPYNLITFGFLSGDLRLIYSIIQLFNRSHSHQSDSQVEVENGSVTVEQRRLDDLIFGQDSLNPEPEPVEGDRGEDCKDLSDEHFSGLDLRTFDWTRRNLLNQESLRILRSGLNYQRLNRPIPIPEEYRFDDLRVERDDGLVVEIDDPDDISIRGETRQLFNLSEPNKPSLKSSESPSPLETERKASVTGSYFNGIFVEDYDDDEVVVAEDLKPRIPSEVHKITTRGTIKRVMTSEADDDDTKPLKTTSSSSERKRSRLERFSSLLMSNNNQNQSSSATPSKDIKPDKDQQQKQHDKIDDDDHWKFQEGDDCSSKSKTLETIEPKRPSPVSGPPFKLKISNIPIDATTESIKTFLEIGSEAYKTARTLNHRIDALGRYVSKYRRSNRQKFPSFQQSELTIYKSNVRTDGIGCDGKAAEGFVENVVKDDGDDDHKIVIVEYGDRRLAMMAYEEFEGKKYLVHDMLCPRLSCQFI